MAERDSFRKYLPTDETIDWVFDRKRAEAELEPLRKNEELRQEIRALRALEGIPPMVAEKGESAHARYTPKPMAAGTVPEEGAPKVKVPLQADTDQFSRETLDKLRIPDGPAPVPATAEEKPSDKPTDPRLGETNLVRRDKKYTPERQAAAREEADTIFAAHAPGSAEFMRGVALCNAYDLKLPVVDLDDVQAFADGALLESLTDAQKTSQGALPLQREADEGADVALPPKRFSAKQIAIGLVLLAFLLPAVIYVGVRLGAPDDRDQPTNVAMPTVSPTAIELVANTVIPLLTAEGRPTADAVETVSTSPTSSTKVSPPDAAVRPDASVRSPTISATPATTGSAPSARPTATAVPPEWD